MWETAWLVYFAIFIIIRFIIGHGKTIIQGFKGYLLKRTVDLKTYGKWAVVTGASDGIGEAYALELAKRGLDIILVARSVEKLQKVANEIHTTYDRKAKIITADFTKTDIYDKIKKEIEGLEVGILVNNVGIASNYPMRFGEASPEDLANMISVNINGTVFMTHLILEQMVKRRKGAIVNLGSCSNLQPLPLMNMYASTKAFVHHFTDALRFEYSKYNITVQTLAPFYVSTKINLFAPKLRKTNVFIPDTTKYAQHAVDTIGVMDHTTGFFPHATQYCTTLILPKNIRMLTGAFIYRRLRREYLDSIKQ